MKPYVNHWRAKSRAVIAQVRREHPEAEGAELKKLISAAYPFGERAMWPYKLWLEEVRKALRLGGKRPDPEQKTAALPLGGEP